MKLDPRVKVSQADLEARFNLLMETRDELSRARDLGERRDREAAVLAAAGVPGVGRELAVVHPGIRLRGLAAEGWETLASGEDRLAGSVELRIPSARLLKKR